MGKAKLVNSILHLVVIRITSQNKFLYKNLLQILHVELWNSNSFPKKRKSWAFTFSTSAKNILLNEWLRDVKVQVQYKNGRNTFFVFLNKFYICNFCTMQFLHNAIFAQFKIFDVLKSAHARFVTWSLFVKIRVCTKLHKMRIFLG